MQHLIACLELKSNYLIYLSSPPQSFSNHTVNSVNPVSVVICQMNERAAHVCYLDSSKQYYSLAGATISGYLIKIYSALCQIWTV